MLPPFYDQLYSLVVSDPVAFRWRFQGIVPTFESFRESLESGVFSQFVVAPRESKDVAIGYVFAYNASLSDGHAYMAALVDRKQGAGLVEAVLLFLRYLFVGWPFRKIYMESIEFNIRQYASAVNRGLMREERRFPEHRFYDGKYWDESTFAIYREDARQFELENIGLFGDSPIHWI